MAGLIDAHMEANGGFAPPTIGAIDPSRTQAGQANIMNLQNKNWGKVTSPSSIKLDGVNDASYSRYLANPENLKKATRSADSMRSDVAPIAKAKMVAAANSAGLRDGQGNVVTFSNIEDLRKHFNITTTSI